MLAAWIEYMGSSARVRVSVGNGSSWTAPVTVATVTDTDTTSAVGDVLPLVGSSGDLSLLWRQTTNNGLEWRVYSSRRLPDGSWDAPATVSGSGENAGAPRGGVDQSGNVTAVFLASTESPPYASTVTAATMSASGVWSSEVALSSAYPGSSPITDDPVVSVGSDGSAVALWPIWSGSVLQAAHRAAGGSWGSVETVSSPGVDGQGRSSSVVMSSDGAVEAAFTTPQPGLGGTEVQEAHRSAFGSWSAPTDVASSAIGPQIALGSGGDVVVGYTAVSFASSRPAARIQRSAVWGPASALGTFFEGATAVKLAAGSAGAILTWQQGDRVYASVQQGGGSWSATQDLDAIANTEAPTVSAAPAAGQEATCASGAWVGYPSPTLSYQWFIDGAPINGATSATYTPSASDGGSNLICRVAATNALASTSIDSGPSSPVAGVAPTPAISASAATVLTGQTVTLHAEGSSDPGAKALRFAWDLDGDGRFETDTGTTSSASASFRSRGVETLGVRVTNTLGLSATATASVDVREAPPAGEVGVSINDGAVATNDPHVKLTVVWPRLARDMLISNDGGFGSAGATRLLTVTRDVPWRLASYGDAKTSRTVYVRFRGTDGAAQTYTDDIILDETAPTIESATVSAVGDSARAASAAAVRIRGYRVRLAAADKQSGVVRLEVSSSPHKAGKIVRVRRSKRVTKSIVFRSRSSTAYVRAEDAGGNFTRWRKAKRSAARH